MRRPAAALALALLLAGCGGGLYLGIGDDGDFRPDVSLAASVDAAHAGENVRLVAAATDDFGIDRVEFFRLEPDGTAVLLASDSFAPYQFDTALPAGPASTVSYFARAVDDIGQSRDSDLVGVTRLP